MKALHKIQLQAVTSSAEKKALKSTQRVELSALKTQTRTEKATLKANQKLESAQLKAANKAQNNAIKEAIKVDKAIAKCNKNIDKVLKNKVSKNPTGLVDNYESVARHTGMDAANKAAKADFNKLKSTNVRTMPNGTIVGDLPGNRTANVHLGASVGDAPTLEIYYRNTGRSTKIRYNP